MDRTPCQPPRRMVPYLKTLATGPSGTNAVLCTFCAYYACYATRGCCRKLCILSAHTAWPMLPCRRGWIPLPCSTWPPMKLPRDLDYRLVLLAGAPPLTPTLATCTTWKASGGPMAMTMKACIECQVSGCSSGAEETSAAFVPKEHRAGAAAASSETARCLSHAYSVLLFVTVSTKQS